MYSVTIVDTKRAQGFTTLAAVREYLKSKHSTNYIVYDREDKEVRVDPKKQS